MIRRIIANNSTIISVISSELTGRSATVPVIPRTNKILNILLHTTFPIAISDCLLREAIIEVTISGAEVPNATIVSPITASETQNEKAIDFAEPTNISAPTARPVKPQTTKTIDFHILRVSSFSELSSSIDHVFISQKVYEKKIIKNRRKIILSPLSKIFSDPPEKNESKARKNKASEAMREKGTSL